MIYLFFKLFIILTCIWSKRFPVWKLKIFPSYIFIFFQQIFKNFFSLLISFTQYTFNIVNLLCQVSNYYLFHTVISHLIFKINLELNRISASFCWLRNW